MYTTGVTPPQGVWWKPAHKSEKVWFTIAFVWCLILFAMMPFWHLRGAQNPTGIRAKVDPQDFLARVQQFVADYAEARALAHMPSRPRKGAMRRYGTTGPVLQTNSGPN